MVFRAESHYYELVILYTTLLLFVLAEWYFNININESTKNWLYFSSIFSVSSLFFAMISNFFMRLTKNKIKIQGIESREIEEFFLRISFGCFFISVSYLFITLSTLYKLTFISSNPISLGFLFVTIFVIFYTIVVMPRIERKKKQNIRRSRRQRRK
jgi:hypothetical protein